MYTGTYKANDRLSVFTPCSLFQSDRYLRGTYKATLGDDDVKKTMALAEYRNKGGLIKILGEFREVQIPGFDGEVFVKQIIDWGEHVRCGDT